jgi:hypothetical protein
MCAGHLTVYRSCTPVADTRFDREGSPTLTEALAVAVAEAEGVDVTDVPPLYDVVDLDALSQLFDGHGRHADPETIVGFRVGTWNVWVRGDGRVRVCDATRTTDPTPVFEDTVA